MSMQKNPFIEYNKISELEQTLIENLNVYRKLTKRMNLIQPKLSLTCTLRKEICWLIGNLEYLKQDDCLIDYKIGWVKDTLKIFCIKNRSINRMTIKLVRHKLIHNNNNNIQIHMVGVMHGQL